MKNNQATAAYENYIRKAMEDHYNPYGPGYESKEVIQQLAYEYIKRDFPEYQERAKLDIAEVTCLNLHKEYGDENTIYTTGVPFHAIGKYDIYLVKLRYYHFFNQKPCWGYSLQSMGSMRSDGDFVSIQEAFLAALQTAKEETEELDARIEAEDKARAERNANK